MSLYDFSVACELMKADHPYYALIMAAMMKSDDLNKGKMRLLWPEVWNELDARYHARGGILPEDDVPPPAFIPSRGDWMTLNIVSLFVGHNYHPIPVSEKTDMDHAVYSVECPWRKEHTTTRRDILDTTLILEPGKWPRFMCLHACCANRGLPELNKLWGDLDSFCEKSVR